MSGWMERDLAGDIAPIGVDAVMTARIAERLQEGQGKLAEKKINIDETKVMAVQSGVNALVGLNGGDIGKVNSLKGQGKVVFAVCYVMRVVRNKGVTAVVDCP